YPTLSAPPPPPLTLPPLPTLLSLLPTLLLPLFFPRPPPPRDLHSFPTRRSSDLTRLSRNHLISPRTWSYPPRYHRPRTNSKRWRSEEHTSELQSRFDLVCRLLLEKKKEITQSHHVRRGRIQARGCGEDGLPVKQR